MHTHTRKKIFYAASLGISLTLPAAFTVLSFAIFGFPSTARALKFIGCSTLFSSGWSLCAAYNLHERAQAARDSTQGKFGFYCSLVLIAAMNGVLCGLAAAESEVNQASGFAIGMLIVLSILSLEPLAKWSVQNSNDDSLLSSGSVDLPTYGAVL